MKHTNNGDCLACKTIMARYPGFSLSLTGWWVVFQKEHPEAHISEAGRGHILQEIYFARGASSAHWGESGHNWNVAMDLWVNENGIYTLPKDWFFNVLKPNIPDWIEWAGEWVKFPEFPHLQIRGWENMAKKGTAKLVEDYPIYKKGA